MPTLVKCGECERRISDQAARKSDGRILCPPCRFKQKRLKRLAEAKRKQEKRKARQEETARRRVEREAPPAEKLTAAAKGPKSAAVILPPETPATGGASAEETEVADFLRAGRLLVFLLRAMAILMAVFSLLLMVGGVVGLISLTSSQGALQGLGAVVSGAVGALMAALPAGLLWAAAGYVSRLSALLGRRAAAE